MKINPASPEVGQGFSIVLSITSPDAVVDDEYLIYVLPQRTPVIIGSDRGKVHSLESDGSTKVTFGSLYGFSAVGHYKFFVTKTTDPFSPIVGAEVECDVVLPASVTPVIPDPPAPETTTSAPSDVETALQVPDVASRGSGLGMLATWTLGIFLVLGVLVIGGAIFGMPAWAIWLISKNANEAPSTRKTEISAQIFNPVCVSDCTSWNLFDSDDGSTKP